MMIASKRRKKHPHITPMIKLVLSSVSMELLVGCLVVVGLEEVTMPSLFFCINSSTVVPDSKGSKRQIQQ